MLNLSLLSKDGIDTKVYRLKKNITKLFNNPYD